MRKRIRRFWQKPQSGPAKIRSLGEELARAIDRERGKKKVIPPDIQYWLLLFDEVIGVWLLVWSFYREEMTRESGQRRMLSVCLVALAGRVFQDMVCIRDQIKLGFFVQSNVVARSLIEAIDVMNLLNAQPGLAMQFRSVELNDQASEFWHRYCSRNRIHKLAKDRWLWLFDGDEEPAEGFHRLRSNYLDLMGMSVHPSFPASVVTFLDSPVGTPSRSIFLNAMGSISHLSKFTMHLIFLRAFEYGMLWVGPQAGLYKSLGSSKKRRRHGKHLKKGLSMLFSVVMTVGKTEEGDPLYPMFETYWPALKPKND